LYASTILYPSYFFHSSLVYLRYSQAKQHL
jgi:hypothetical protein